MSFLAADLQGNVDRILPQVAAAVRSLADQKRTDKIMRTRSGQEGPLGDPQPSARSHPGTGARLRVDTEPGDRH